jgi:hypothetical protein
MKTERVEHRGKQVGVMVDGILYLSQRRQSKHLFRGGAASIGEAKRMKRAAWGIDNDLLGLLHACGVKVVAVSDEETGKLYWAALTTLQQHGSYLDMGHGLQRFLPLHEWHLAGNLAQLLDATHNALRRTA